jgi:hypothetical protein
MRQCGRAGLAAICVTCLVSCGGLGEYEAQASAAARTFARALEAGDGLTACQALAPETRSALTDALQMPCADSILTQHIPAGGVARGVDVYGRQARVVMVGDTVFLSRFQSGWRVVAAGCQPRPSRPYQCQVGTG